MARARTAVVFFLITLCPTASSVAQSMRFLTGRRHRPVVVRQRGDCAPGYTTSSSSRQSLYGYPTVKRCTGKGGEMPPAMSLSRGRNHLCAMRYQREWSEGSREGLGKPNHEGIFEIKATPGESTGLTDLLSLIERTDALVMVLYHAQWCRACKYVRAKMGSIAKQAGYEDVIFVSVDQQGARAVCRDMEIKEYPTIHMFRNARKVEEVKGIDLKRIINSLHNHMKK
mmetsp:Transcript_23807/g.38234  ORF Transcript_23807/g.38234 Transcript_23807/m.38234 type:complete len:227 (+) Transcript_23807:103-783(+)